MPTLGLLDYKQDPDAWAREFLQPEIAAGEWDLVLDEPIENVLVFPLFKPAFCEALVERLRACKDWRNARHRFYPTVDVGLEAVGLETLYPQILNAYVHSVARVFWQLEGHSWEAMGGESFIARYRADDQSFLAAHHDESDFTAIVTLNADFEGGGTWFVRQKALLRLDPGYVAIHPGRLTHRHGARAVRSGERFVLVSFCRRSGAKAANV